MKTLLFVTTEPSLSGAPVYLLKHLKLIKDRYNTEIIVLFMYKNGALVEQFNKVATVYYWEDILSGGLSSNFLTKYIYKKVIKKIEPISYFLFRMFFAFKLSKCTFSSIIVNSSTIDKKAIFYLKKVTSVPVITIVHEGEKLLKIFNQDGIVEANLANSDHIIAVSEYLKKVLLDLYTIKKEITVITGAINDHQQVQIDDSLILDYKIPENAQVVMSSGWLSWHKGSDFFIQTAIKITKSHANVHFCWLGDAATDVDNEQFKFDISKAGLENRVHHIPSTHAPLSYFKRADVFLMLSRNESFSLVTVEACSLKKPVLCFEKSGGPCEILNYDTNLVTPYGDIDLLCEKLVGLLESDEKRRQIGQALYDRVMSNYTLEKTASQLQNLIGVENL
jgi:glycosyltransferase involved in cell wall biosynthesis